MFSLTVKGNSLKELRDNLGEISDELIGAAILSDDVVSEVADIITSSANPAMEQLTSEKVTELAENTVLPLAASTNLIGADPTASRAPRVADANAELDIEGLPWDSRIHTDKRTKKATGEWKLTRGIDKNLVAQVKAELRTAPVVQAPIGTVISLTPTATITPAPVTVTPNEAAPIITAPVMSTPVIVPPQPMQANGHTLQTFIANFPMVLSGLLSSDKVKQPYIEELCTYFQVEQIWSITDDQKGQMFNSLVENNIIQKVG